MGLYTYCKYLRLVKCVVQMFRTYKLLFVPFNKMYSTRLPLT